LDTGRLVWCVAVLKAAEETDVLEPVETLGLVLSYYLHCGELVEEGILMTASRIAHLQLL
jgi:hypothetical protein